MAKKLDTGFWYLGKFLIDKAFADRHYLVRKRYYGFSVRTFMPAKKTMLGSYNGLSSYIFLYGMATRCRSDIVITFLHELSHHIETMDFGSSGHQASFYKIHIKLLQTAIDYGMITLEDVASNTTSDAGNAKKLGRMMKGYQKQEGCVIPSTLDLSFLQDLHDEPVVDEDVVVRCPQSESELFKKRHYHYSPEKKVWTFHVTKYALLKTEEDFLKENGYFLISVNKHVYYAKYITIVVSGDTYSCKEALKSLEYVYHKEKKVWEKSVPVPVWKTEVQMLRNIAASTIQIHYK